MATKTTKKTTSKTTAVEELDPKVTVKATKEASALLKLAKQVDEKFKVFDPVLIKGIPVRTKYKANVKELRASVAKMVKFLDDPKLIFGIPFVGNANKVAKKK
jgi:hypothetical protein